MAQFLDPDLFAQIGRAIAFIMGHQTDISDEAVTYFERVLPAWTVGENVKKGMIRTYEGTRYRCLQDHTCTAEWTPTAAVSLWAKVLPRKVPARISARGSNLVQPTATPRATR